MLNDCSIPDINARDSKYFNYTALHFQTACGTIEAMEWLLSRDPPADISVRDKDGKVALHLAAIAKNPEKVRLLLEFGADRNTLEKFDDATSYTPLMYANLFGYKDVAAILETYFPETKADQLERNITLFNRSHNPFDRKLCEQMLKEGRVPYCNVVGATSFYAHVLGNALYAGTLEDVEWLLNCDPPANPYIQQQVGRHRALHFAADTNSPKKVRLLLDYGADRSYMDKYDGTPLDMAKERGRSQDVINALKTYFPEENKALLLEMERGAVKKAKQERLE